MILGIVLGAASSWQDLFTGATIARIVGTWFGVALVGLFFAAIALGLGFGARRSLAGPDPGDVPALRRRITRNWLLGTAGLFAVALVSSHGIAWRGAKLPSDLLGWLVFVPIHLSIAVSVGLIGSLASRWSLRRALARAGHRDAADAAFDLGVDPAMPPGAAAARWNVVARHWRGALPLWVAYWVVGFAVSIGVIVFGRTLSFALGIEQTYEPMRALAQIAGVWLFALLVTVWQVVGVWRSARRHIAAGRSRWWARLAQAAVALGVVGTMASFAGTGVAQLTEGVRMAFLGDPQIPDYRLRLLRGGTELELAGGFKYGITTELRRMLDAAPGVKVIHLNSIGGRMGEAEKVFHLLRERGLAAYSASGCFSACTLAFAGANVRWLHPNARLGFHAPTFPGVRPSNEAHQRERALMITAGMSEDFVDRALATPNSTMWYPTETELFDGHAITGIVGRGQFAVSGFGIAIDRAAMAKIVADVDFYAALQQASPADFERVVTLWLAGYESGEPEPAITARSLGVARAVAHRLRPTADDAVLIEAARLQIERGQFLQRLAPTLCHAYLSGYGGLPDATIFPAPLILRDDLLTQQILLTARLRAPADADVARTYREQVWTKLRWRFGDATGLLGDTRPANGAQHADYCRVAIGQFEEILALEAAAAALLLREVFAVRR